MISGHEFKPHTEFKPLLKNKTKHFIPDERIDMYRISHPKSAEYTFFASAHGTFGIDHMLVHKTSLNQFKNIKIISSTFTNNNGMKLEINIERQLEK